MIASIRMRARRGSGRAAPFARTLAAGMLLLVVGCGGKGGGEDLETTPVERGAVEVTVTAAGPVQPYRAVEVKSRASGEVLELPYDAGARVSEGTTLVVIDPREELEKVRLAEADLMTAEARRIQAEEKYALDTDRIQLEKERAEASLTRARAELAQAEIDLEREEGLHAKGLSSDRNKENAATRVRTARAALRQAEADLLLTRNQSHQLAMGKQDVVLAEAGVIRAEVALDRARERLSDTRIRATLDGIILERKVEVGQIIASGISNIGGGTTLLVVADDARLSVKAMVDEADIGTLEEGHPARISADAFPDRSFEGEIGWIAPLGVTASDVTAFEVLVEVLGEGKRFLRPGMTATCQFVTHRADGVLWIPPAALRRYRDETYVNLADPAAEGGYRGIGVEVGLRSQDRVEVRGEELREGAAVLLSRPDETVTGTDRRADPIWFLKKKREKTTAKPRGGSSS